MRAKERDRLRTVHRREQLEGLVIREFRRNVAAVLLVAVATVAWFAMGERRLGLLSLAALAVFVLLAALLARTHRRMYGRWPWRS